MLDQETTSYIDRHYKHSQIKPSLIKYWENGGLAGNPILTFTRCGLLNCGVRCVWNPTVCYSGFKAPHPLPFFSYLSVCWAHHCLKEVREWNCVTTRWVRILDWRLEVWCRVGKYLSTQTRTLFRVFIQPNKHFFGTTCLLPKAQPKAGIKSPTF